MFKKACGLILNFGKTFSLPENINSIFENNYILSQIKSGLYDIVGKYYIDDIGYRIIQGYDDYKSLLYKIYNTSNIITTKDLTHYENMVLEFVTDVMNVYEGAFGKQTKKITKEDMLRYLYQYKKHFKFDTKECFICDIFYGVVSGNIGQIVEGIHKFNDDIAKVHLERLINIKGLTKEEKKELTDFFIYDRKITGFKKVLHKLFVELRSLYRFIGYTVNVPAGLMMATLQALGYMNLKTPFKKGDLLKAKQILDEFKLIPSSGFIINQLFSELSSVGGGGSYIQNLVGKIAYYITGGNKIEKSNPYVKVFADKARQLIIQSSGGIHQIVDLFYDNTLKSIAVLRAAKNMGFTLDELKDVLKNEDIYNEFKKEVIKKYEEMRGFSIFYGLDKIKGGYWRGFLFFTNFMGTWGLNVMRHAIRNLIFPIEHALNVYISSGDIKLAKDAFLKGLDEEGFVFTMLTMAHSAVIGQWLYRATDDNNDDESIITGLLKAGSFFNIYLQSFESNVLGRLGLSIYEGLTYEGIDGVGSTGYAVYKGFNELTRGLLKELKVVDPFVKAAKAYTIARKSGLSIEDAYQYAIYKLIDGFKQAFGGYVRYMSDEILSNIENYYLPTSKFELLGFIVGQNLNEFKNKFYDLKTYEQYIGFVENPTKGLIKYLLWNLPILKNFTSEDISNYFGKLGLGIQKLSNDVVLNKMRITGEIPVVLPEVNFTIQEKWVNKLYKNLIKYTPERIYDIPGIRNWADKEIKRIYENIPIEQVKEDIWVMKMVDALGKGEYDKLYSLYKEVEGLPKSDQLKGYIQLLGMAEANSPGSTRKMISFLAYTYSSGLAKEKFGKTWSQLTRDEKYLIELETAKKFVPLLAFKGKGYIDYTYLVDAAEEYIKLVYPNLLNTSFNGKKYLSTDLKNFITLDLFTQNLINSGYIDAFAIKNVFAKLGTKIKDEGLRIRFLNKILGEIQKTEKISDVEKTAMKAGIILSNLNIFDKLLKDPIFKENYGKLGETLIKILWQTSKEINELGEDIVKKKFINTYIKSKGGKIKLNGYNRIINDYTRYRPLFNKLYSYARQNYPRFIPYAKGGGYYIPYTSPGYGPGLARYIPYFTRGYNQARSYPTKALSKRLIKEITKENIPRFFTYNYGREQLLK